MSIHRDTIPFGPAKIVHGSDTFYSAGDIDVTVVTERADVNPDQYGQGVKTVIDQIIEVVFKPQSLWSLLDKVYPSAEIAPTIGSRSIGASPTALIIHGEDSSLLTIPCPAITGMPSLMLGVDKGEFGTMKYTGIVTNGKNIGESGALYTYAATGGTYGTPATPDYLAAAQWDVTWKSTALTGTLLESVTINPELKIEAVKAGPRTMDFRRRGIQFTADIIAAADLTALSGIINDAATFKFGGRNTADGGDLVLTSVLGHTFTMVTAALDKAAMKYAMKQARPRALSFRTAALTGARVSWTTPA